MLVKSLEWTAKYFRVKLICTRREDLASVTIAFYLIISQFEFTFSDKTTAKQYTSMLYNIYVTAIEHRQKSTSWLKIMKLKQESNIYIRNGDDRADRGRQHTSWRHTVNTAHVTNTEEHMSWRQLTGTQSGWAIINRDSREWDVTLRGVHVRTHINRHARTVPLWAAAIKTTCQSHFLVGGRLGYSHGFRREERKSRLMLRVVLEEEWTKARQGTEEVCCWGAQDKLCLDSLQMSQFLGFGSFIGLVWKISQGHKVSCGLGVKNMTWVRLEGRAGHEFL